MSAAKLGQSCSMWPGVWMSVPHWHCAVPTTSSLFMWARRPQCPVLRRYMMVAYLLSRSSHFFLILCKVV
jgi:hypothetical protein